MSKALVVGTVLAALFALEYQVHLKPALQVFGVGRNIENVNNHDCTVVPQLKACEKLVLEPYSGIVYAACSTLESRAQWLPYFERFTPPTDNESDYIAAYDPSKKRVTRLTLSGMPDKPSRGLSVHGLDVVQSEQVPDMLWFYVVNHRVPLDADPKAVGADSSIELFMGWTGGETLEWVKTFNNTEVMISPNDVFGEASGNAFWFTNDHGERTGWKRHLKLAGRKASSIGYCHTMAGCSFAATGLTTANGIVKSRDPANTTFYVSDSTKPEFRILERFGVGDNDGRLAVTNVITLDRPLDNLSLSPQDNTGVVFAAGFPKSVDLLLSYIKDPRNVKNAASVHKIGMNGGKGAFFGENHVVEKVFEDDGGIVSAASSAVYDSARKQLFLSGIMSTGMAVCNVKI